MINAEDATRPELEAMIYVAQGRRDPHTAQTLFNELLAHVRAEGIAVPKEQDGVEAVVENTAPTPGESGSDNGTAAIATGTTKTTKKAK